MIEGGLWRCLACVIGLALLSACSKGATSIDLDADRAEDLSNDEEKDPTCGNGVINERVGEECDGNALGGVTCVSLGFIDGTLTCDPITCVFDTSMCTRPAISGGGTSG